MPGKKLSETSCTSSRGETSKNQCSGSLSSRSGGGSTLLQHLFLHDELKCLKQVLVGGQCVQLLGGGESTRLGGEEVTHGHERGVGGRGEGDGDRAYANHGGGGGGGGGGGISSQRHNGVVVVQVVGGGTRVVGDGQPTGRRVQVVR